MRASLRHLEFHRQRQRRSSDADRRLRFEALEDRRVLTAWVPAGPSPIQNGQVENIPPSNEVIGAIHAVVAHPEDADTLYIGAVNGGVWKTTNATSDDPVWTPLTDHLSSLSMGDLEMDPTDPETLLGGIGRSSSFGQTGGELTGLILTRDGGETWTELSDPLLVGKDISGVWVQGDLMMAASNGGFDFASGTGGLFRSTDGGNTWTSIEVVPRPNELSNAVPFNAFDLVADPTDPDRFYLSVMDVGIFRSENAGATWTNVSDNSATLSSLIRFSLILDPNGADVDMDGNVDLIQVPSQGENNNAEMSVSSNGRIFIGIIELGQMTYIGYSDDQGNTWIAMDLPLTPEANGAIEGLQPRQKAGAQGGIHFSIIADPNDPDIVYVGGDRQGGDTNFPFGNFIGAVDFSGRLFRGDASVPATGIAGFQQNIPSPQWEHLTHRDDIFQIPGGGTASSSAPHADSRDMAFDANGDLIEVDDGGIFRRTSPQDNRGDWFAMQGNLQVTEFHDIAYDTNSNIILGGAQDVGTPQQNGTALTDWAGVQVFDSGVAGRINADGGDVAVDTTSMPGFSIRYSSSQNLGFVRQQIFDSQNNFVSQTLLATAPFFSFRTPLELNQVDPTRIIVANEPTVFPSGYWESMDQGQTFVLLPVFDPTFVNLVGHGFLQNALAYGGFKDGVPNPDILYAASFDEILVRRTAGDNLEFTRAEFPGLDVRDIILDPDDWMTAFAIDDSKIFVTDDVGDSWRNITGNLASLAPGELRSLQYIEGETIDALVLGTDRGIFTSPTDNLGSWSRLGTGLPNAPVYDLDYDPFDDVLVAGTLGRGAWLLAEASQDVTDRDTSPTLVPHSINGMVFNDLDGDGSRDTLEPGVTNWNVYIDLNRNGQLDVGETRVPTDRGGHYTLGRLAAGTYSIGIDVPDGWIQTTPASSPISVTVRDGRATANVDFGNRLRDQIIEVPDVDTGDPDGDGGDDMGGVDPGDDIDVGGIDLPEGGFVTGIVFDDTNGNGVQDAGEPGLQGLTVFIDTNQSCAIGLAEPSARTGPDGRYTIDGLAPGEYEVDLVPHPGRIHPLPCTSTTVTIDEEGNADREVHFATDAIFDLVPSSATSFTPSHGFVPGFLLGDELQNDGIAFITGVHPGETETVVVIAHQLAVSPGHLWAWIDFDGNGEFDDDEQIFAGRRLVDGQNVLTFDVPLSAVEGPSTARFRWAFETELTAGGSAFGGETEDYDIIIPMEGDARLMPVPDTFDIIEDSTNNIFDVLINDAVGPLGGTPVIEGVTNPGNGQVAIENGMLVYSPDANFFGTDTFDYLMGDSLGNSTTVTVTVNVSAVNDLPTARDDSFAAVSDSPSTSLDVLANDTTEPDMGETLTITGFSSPSSGGQLALAQNGTHLVYTAPGGFVGTETFEYTINDGNGGIDTATVTIDVSLAPAQVRFDLEVVDANDNPISSANVGELFYVNVFVTDLRPAPQGVFSAYLDVFYDDASLVFVDGDLDFNDADFPHSQRGSATLGLVNEAGAVADLSPMVTDALLLRIPFRAVLTGNVQFNADFADLLPTNEVSLNGRDIAVPERLIEFGQAMIAIGGAVDDFFTVAEDSQDSVLDVLSNDVAFGADSFVITDVSSTTGGQITIVDGSLLQYSPEPDFFGEDSLTYFVEDSLGRVSQADVLITVTPVNDPPTAVDDLFELAPNNRDVLLDVLANDSSAPDPDTETLTIIATSNTAVEGSVVTISGDGQSVFYTPAPGFDGTDSFVYTVSDGDALAQATVTLDVNAFVGFRLALTDTTGAPITSTRVGDEFVLEVYVEDLRDDPAGVFSAYLDVLYTANLVTATGPPSFEGSIYTNGQSGNVNVVGVISEAGGVDGISPLGGGEFFLFSVPMLARSEGTATFESTITGQNPLRVITLFDSGTPPAPVGADLIRFGTATIEIRFEGAVNDVFSALEDSQANILPVLNNDNDVALPSQRPLTIVSVGPTSAGGFVEIVDGTTLSYTPATDFNGNETFTYTIEDNLGTRTQASVTVNVSPVNDDPMAVDDQETVLVDSVNNEIDVLANDTIAPDENEVLSVIDVSQPSRGGTALIAIGTDGPIVVYTPPAGFEGQETFTYTISDGNNGTDEGLVTINVVPEQIEPLVNFELVFTDTFGTPIETADAGEPFQLRVFVQDIRPDPLGVFSAFMDISYSGAIVTGPIDFNDEVYGSTQSGNTSIAGLIDELGAVDGVSPLRTGDPVLLATIPMSATSGGTVTANSGPADLVPPNETTLFGLNRVIEDSEIIFGSDTLSVSGAAVAGTPFMNAANPYDVNDDKRVSPLDALLVINQLDEGTRILAPAGTQPAAGGAGPVLYVDVNGDNLVSPIDALLVINNIGDTSIAAPLGLRVEVADPESEAPAEALPQDAPETNGNEPAFELGIPAGTPTHPTVQDDFAVATSSHSLEWGRRSAATVEQMADLEGILEDVATDVMEAWGTQ